MIPNQALSKEQEIARTALGELERPGADPAFRAALKAAFVTGAVPALEAEDEAAPVVYQPSSAPWWRNPLGLRWAMAPLAMAALAIGLVLADRGPAWRMASTTGDGIVMAGNHAVSARHTEELEQWMRPGTRVRVPLGSSLEIVSAGTLAIQVTTGTEFVVPEPPGRWFKRHSTTRVQTGELRITSGPRFAGALLEIVTPEAKVELRGTTVAVICEPAGTCVCVHDGVAMVGTLDGPMVPVHPGERRFVFREGGTPEHAHIRDTEVGALETFRERGKELLGR